AALQQSRSALAIAQKALADGAIIAPVSGQVAARSAEPGQIVAPGASILRVVSLNSIYFEPSVPDREVGAIRTGQRVSVSVDAFPSRAFEGQVVRVYPAGSTRNRAFPVRIAVENPDRLLRPQMFARGRIETQRQANAVLVPRDAVRADKDD